MTRRMVMAATLALSLGALPLLAQGPGQRFGGPGRGPGGPGAIFPMIQQLDLTDAQQEQLRALMEDNRPSGDPGAAVRAAEQKLHAAVLADPPDLQTIESQRAALNAAHAAELDHQIMLMEKVAPILTPAQKQQLLALQAQAPRGRGRGL